MPMTGVQALAALTGNPRPFLRKYPLRIAGANSPSGITGYKIFYYQPSERPGSVLKTKNMHATDLFRVDNQLTLAVPNSHIFQAHSIYMAQSNVPTVLYPIAVGAGPDILITGALSGCSFIVDDGPNPGDIACAHLQPHGETAVALEARLLPLHDHVYGVSQYGHTVQTATGALRDRNVSIVGVRANNRWKIYAQKLDLMNNYAIRSVHRIYPPE